MNACPKCKNLNVVNEPTRKWCRSCGWTSDGSETPRLAARPVRN